MRNITWYYVLVMSVNGLVMAQVDRAKGGDRPSFLFVLACAFCAALALAALR